MNERLAPEKMPEAISLSLAAERLADAAATLSDAARAMSLVAKALSQLDSTKITHGQSNVSSSALDPAYHATLGHRCKDNGAGLPQPYR
jgi:hypothetical protein